MAMMTPLSWKGSNVMAKDVYILAIETSCDETSMAIVKNGQEVISLVINSQIKTHEKFGGVVPEIASRMHTEAITVVLDELMQRTLLDKEQIDAIAVTYAPGLLGSLLVGLEAAKTISFVWQKPLILVDHMAGHIYANQINHTLSFPLLALVVSGGHTSLIVMPKDNEFELLGATLDDAVGECYDKVARILGMKYPGGPNVEKAALLGNNNYLLPKAMNDNSLNFSYSGLKSAMINLVHNETDRGNEINNNDLCASFQEAAVEQLINKTRLALKQNEYRELLIAGGVSANKYLQAELVKLGSEFNIPVHFPEFIYCTDNAAMIGAAAYSKYLNQDFADLDANASPQDTLFN